VVASQVADLTDRVPQAITGAHPIRKMGHVAWEWPRELNELPIILNKMLGPLRLDLQLPDSGFRDRSEARGWTSGDTRQVAPPLPRFPATRLTPLPPHMRGRGGTPWGSSASGEPAAGRIPSVPSVSGWSRLGASSRPQIGRWDRRQCHMPDFWAIGRPKTR
jgi:hypothetical protein